MKTADAIIAAEARAARAESATLESQIKLAICRARLAELEAADTKRKDAEATCAVRQLVLTGAIRKTDTFNQHLLKAQFLADPALIPLAVGKPFNQGKRASK